MSRSRCSWVTTDPLYLDYHDNEWGRPVYDDRKLFELLTLEGAQAGLSWVTILKRRENYRKAFDNFQPEIIAGYNEEKVESLLQNEGIIRNRRKILSVIQNAKAFLELQAEFGSFAAYVWQFVDGKSLVNHWEQVEDVPAKTEISEKLSKDLKRRNFSFVGPTICYAYMQAAGLVNDHVKSCFLYGEIND